jgi:hypothetical protein
VLLGRPGWFCLPPVDAVIEVVKSDCPNEWARYCDLAYQLVQRKQPTEISQEAAGRQHFAENGESVQQKTAEMARMASFYSELAGGPAEPLAEFEIILRETRSLEIMLRERLTSALQTGRYSLIAFDRFVPFVVSPLLIRRGSCCKTSNDANTPTLSLELPDGVRCRSPLAFLVDDCATPGRAPDDPETACRARRGRWPDLQSHAWTGYTTRRRATAGCCPRCA